jgi:hypothetical protein
VKIWPGLRIESGDEIGGPLNLLRRGSETARDFGKAAFAEVLNETIDDSGTPGSVPCRCA